MLSFTLRAKITPFSMKPSMRLVWAGVAAVAILMAGGMVHAVDISDSPMDTKVEPAPPNIMFVYDNSGSMDWETMTQDTDGVFEGTYEYLFDDPGDNAYSTGSSNGTILTGSNRGKWKSQWHGYNKIFYNPDQDYLPWPGMPEIDINLLNQVPSNPYYPSVNPFDLTAEYYAVTDHTGAVQVDNSDAGFSVLAETDWGYSSYSGDVGSDYRYNNAITADSWARWTPTFPGSGKYRVYAWFRELSGRSDDVTYTVKHAPGGGPLGTGGGHDGNDSTTLVPDECPASVNGETIPNPISHSDADGMGDKWILLGEFDFAGDGSDYVQVNADIIAEGFSGLCCKYSADAVMFVPSSSTTISVRNAHYYTWDDENGNDSVDNGEVYLVNFFGGVRSFYRFTDTNGNNRVEDGELEEVDDAATLDRIKPKLYDEDHNVVGIKTDEQDLQNFANWYAYYRRRELTAKAAVAHSIYGLDRVNIGFYTINSGVRSAVKPVKTESNAIIVDNKDNNFDKVSGSWYTSGASGPYAGNSVYASTKSPASVARWTPNLPSTQTYKVYVWYTYYSTRDTNALYSIYPDGDDTVSPIQVRVNQQQNAGDWFYIGEAEFPAGSKGYVTVTRDSSSTNSSTSADAVKFELTSGGVTVDETSALLDALYSINSGDGTPLRSALDEVGKYYHTDLSSSLGSSPYADVAGGGECQQSFAIVMTDGYYNGSTPSGINNQDGTEGAPFADSYSDTLADVAMKYYKNDLAPSLDPKVPQNATACDFNNQQHMVSYSVSFGVTGTIDPEDIDNNGTPDYPGYKEDPCFLGGTPMPTWPNPTSGNPQKIDDLWHTAVNGHGLFFSAADPGELVASLKTVMEDISSRAASGASVSVNGQDTRTADALYLATYRSGSWVGDVTAYKLNAATGTPNMTEAGIKWRASGEGSWTGLQDVDPSQRNIVTPDGSGGAIAFEYDQLSTPQKILLDPDWTTSNQEKAQNMVDYLRGTEINGFRYRDRRLGDIVHSAPLYFEFNHTVYAGGNDGMLHAFNSYNGQERYAYIPQLVFENLKELADPNYTHKFYVDATPTVTQTGQTSAILVGGLGKGGKGYYALDVSGDGSIYTTSDESSALPVVKWEYGSSDADMGYSFSRAWINKSNASAYAGSYLVFFGNGYQSVNGHAVFYVLDADSGALVKKIDTDVGSDNGLSTPVLVDVNNDYKVDYAYAGDLKGNLWKFDLTSSDISEWSVAYGETDMSGNIVTPKPLFAAGSTQPITAQPDVMRHCLRHGYMVVFGTGQFLGEADRDITPNTQTIYGIWDYGDDDDNGEYLGSFDRTTGQLSNQPTSVTLLEQTIDSTWDNYGRMSDNEATDGSDYWPVTDDGSDGYGGQTPVTTQLPNPNLYAGWYHDLQANERVFKNVTIRNGRAIVIAFKPESSPCSGGGVSKLYEISACDGSDLGACAFTEDCEADIIESPGIIHEPVIIIIDDPAPRDWDDDGDIDDDDIPPPLEVKNQSNSSGGVTSTEETGPNLKTFYWIER